MNPPSMTPYEATLVREVEQLRAELAALKAKPTAFNLPEGYRVVPAAFVEQCRALVDDWRTISENSREEAKRIRAVTAVHSSAEERCLIRANLWETCAKQVESLFPVTPAPERPPMKRPTIVCLCGSTRFYEQFQKANYAETMAGKIVLSVGHYPHSPEVAHGESTGCTPEQKITLDELHKRKIDLADEVLILNVGGYIGESTRSELVYAQAHGKHIRFLEEVYGITQGTPPMGSQHIAAEKMEKIMCVMRCEVKISPVRCKCGGVGVLLHDPNSPRSRWQINCPRNLKHSTSWCLTKEEALSEWAAQNAPPPEPELLPCPAGCNDGIFFGNIQYQIEDDPNEAQHAQCKRCSFRGPMGVNRKDATERWNRRAAPAEDAEWAVLCQDMACNSHPIEGRQSVWHEFRRQVAKRYPQPAK